MDVEALRPIISATELVDALACRAELVAIRVVRGLLDAREVEVVRRLDELAESSPALFPQDVVASSSKCTLGAAERLRERAATAADIPELGAALAAGSTTGDRVDIVARAAAGLSPAERRAMAAHGPELAAAACEQTPGGVRAAVERVVRKVRADDGLERLAKQRRMARLRWWLDSDGLWCLAGRFDPATGARMEGRLANEIERQRAAGLPAGFPTDPLERHQHLAALALASLLGLRGAAHGEGAGVGAAGGGGDGAGDGGDGADARAVGTAGATGAVGTTWATGTTGATGVTDMATGTDEGAGAAGTVGSSLPDVTVVIDAQTLLTGRMHEGTVFDVGAGLGRFGLPVETVRRWVCIGTAAPVVVGADGVRLFLGRETRLANRAQRRALRVLYRTCALCEASFAHCQVHHVDWFTPPHHGRTDIDNLVPLCLRHHHLVHEGGWVLHLAADRTLTVTRPGGGVTVHGPPSAWAA